MVLTNLQGLSKYYKCKALKLGQWLAHSKYAVNPRWYYYSNITVQEKVALED